MTRLRAEIEEDRDTLLDLMEQLDVARNPVKQATGLARRDREPGEVQRGRLRRRPSTASSWRSTRLLLGVLGKLSLWRALLRGAQPRTRPSRRSTWTR